MLFCVMVVSCPFLSSGRLYIAALWELRRRCGHLSVPPDAMAGARHLDEASPGAAGPIART